LLHFTSIYACGSRIRVGCSRHPSRYSARRRLQRLRIGRPVVHDGLERFHASRHGRAQCMPHILSHEARPERRAVGVTRLGPDGIFMYSDLALSSHCRFFRASVRLACSLLEHPQLTRWSVDELVVLFTWPTGAPACYGLRQTSSWCDMMDLCGSKQVADMLLERTLCVYDKRVWQHVSDCWRCRQRQ